jgi:hypothetical protein
MVFSNFSWREKMKKIVATIIIVVICVYAGNLYAENFFKEVLKDVSKDMDASKKSKPAAQTKLPYFAKAKVDREVTLYSDIAGKPVNTRVEFVPEGYPTGRKIGVLKPGEIIELMQMHITWGEQPYSFKVRTARGTVGYVFRCFTITETVGDRGAMILIHFNEGGEFEGNIDAVDASIAEYAQFVKDYPDSGYVPEALLNIVHLHIYTLQSNVDKRSRLDRIMAIVKKLSAERKYSADFRKATNALIQYISEHQDDLLAKEVKFDILDRAWALQGACLSHVPNSMR